MDTQNHRPLKIGDSLHEGELIIIFNPRDQRLYIESDSTLELWDDPIKALSDNKNGRYDNVLKDKIEGSCRLATWEEIVEFGWDKYVVNRP